MEQLCTADACVAVMTPAAVRNVWVQYETGGAYAQLRGYRPGARLFVAVARGIKPGILPEPLRPMQAQNLANGAEVHHLCREVALSMNSRGSFSEADLRRLTKLASKGFPHWDRVHSSLVGEQQSTSPFSFEHLVALARHRVFAAGFNLQTVAKTPEFQEGIPRFLAKQRSRKVELMVTIGKPIATHSIAVLR